MSEIKVNKISPRTACGTTTLGDSGDTFTIPAGATITNSGTANGFGADGAVNWQTTIKTSTFTAVNQEGYFCNTSGGAFTVNLPSASVGNIISIKDYSGSFGTNDLTISPNGSDKIDGVNDDAVLSTDNLSVTLVYADTTKGWLNVNDSTTVEGSSFITATGGTITTCGDFKIHTFTGPGTFCVSAGSGPLSTAEYLVVAGGGGGGRDNGGGGGAGGFRFASSSIAPLTYPGKPLAAPANLPVSIQGYPIVVGAGSAGGPGPGEASAPGVKGNNSSFSTITSTGGGGGGSDGGAPYATAPTTGGSGGGLGQNSTCGTLPATAGIGNNPPVSPPQGNPGGILNGNPNGGGGGGGAMAAGQAGSGSANGQTGGVGAGLPTAFGSNGQPCGSFRYYAGGAGGGVGQPGSGTGGSGGLGGGAAGGPNNNAGSAGTVNTGGGGGGGGQGVPNNSAGAGGSGIVVIRYKFQ